PSVSIPDLARSLDVPAGRARASRRDRASPRSGALPGHRVLRRFPGAGTGHAAAGRRGASQAVRPRQADRCRPEVRLSTLAVPEFRLVECIDDDEQPRRDSTVLVDQLLALQPSGSLHHVSYVVRPQPGWRDELLRTLCELAKGIRKEPGCVVCAVCLAE